MRWENLEAPDLGMFGISRFAQWAVENKEKIWKKIQKEDGSFNEDKLFKRCFSLYCIFV